MNANSNGSVTPQTNAQRAAAPTRPAASFLLSGFAEWIIAKAAAGRPNIIHGKKPDIYIPACPPAPLSSSPAQKLPRSLMPAASNQNTEFNA